MSIPVAIGRITNYMGRIDLVKPRLAMELLSTKAEFNWKETEYKSWRGFCNLEVALSYSTVYRYLKTAELANQFTYSMVEILNIVKIIGWSRFQLGLTKLENYIDIEEFIEKFKDLNLNERIVFEEKETDLIQFSFSLPEHTAELLNNELVVRGMRVNNRNRTNASSAMVKLVRDITKGQ